MLLWWAPVSLWWLCGQAEQVNLRDKYKALHFERVEQFNLFKQQRKEQRKSKSQDNEHGDREQGAQNSELKQFIPYDLSEDLYSENLQGINKESFPTNRSIYVFGDFHGDFDITVGMLQAAGLIGANGDWVGGSSEVVQVGDIADRGPDAPIIYELFWSLRHQLNTLRKENGQKGEGLNSTLGVGHIMQLIGNHEVAVLKGQTYYVSKKEQSEYWSGKNSFVNEWKYNGYLGYHVLKSFHVSLQLGDLIFVHAGLLPAYAKYSDETLDAMFRKELGGKNTLEHEYLSREDSPVWTRDYSKPPHSCKNLAHALKLRNATKTISGHTPMHHITPFCKFMYLCIHVSIYLCMYVTCVCNGVLTQMCLYICVCTGDGRYIVTDVANSRWMREGLGKRAESEPRMYLRIDVTQPVAMTEQTPVNVDSEAETAVDSEATASNSTETAVGSKETAVDDQVYYKATRQFVTVMVEGLTTDVSVLGEPKDREGVLKSTEKILMTDEICFDGMMKLLPCPHSEMRLCVCIKGLCINMVCALDSLCIKRVCACLDVCMCGSSCRGG